MKEFGIKCKLMGSVFELLVIKENKEEAFDLLYSGIEEIKRIENLLSEFIPDSTTAKINNNAWREPLVIENECFDLIERCLDISKLSKGNFDISVSPLKKLYSFKNNEFEIPSVKIIKKTLQNIGYNKIDLNKKNQSISFKNKDLKISFSAIGKGYASDMVKRLWIKKGVKAGCINASGDLNAFGIKPNGEKWKIGIANPDNKNEVLIYVPLYNASVATSGDYEQNFTYKNIRYSHNINPHTGMPVTGIKSVSIFSPSAELSDALATAVYVMGTRKGIDYINQLPQTHCIIIDSKNKIYFSNKLVYEETVI